MVRDRCIWKVIRKSYALGLYRMVTLPNSVTQITPKITLNYVYFTFRVFRHIFGMAEAIAFTFYIQVDHINIIVRPHHSRPSAYVDASYMVTVRHRVVWSVYQSVCHSREPYKNGWTDRDAIWVLSQDESKESCIRWGQDPPWDGTILGKEAPIEKCRQTAEPIEMPSDGPTEACVTWGALWRHLANAIEPSVCSGDAAFLSNYFDHLLVLGWIIKPKLEWV